MHKKFTDIIFPYIITIKKSKSFLYKKITIFLKICSVFNTQQIDKCDKMVRILEKWDFYAEERSIGATIFYSIEYFLIKKLLP